MVEEKDALGQSSDSLITIISKYDKGHSDRQ